MTNKGVKKVRGWGLALALAALAAGCGTLTRTPPVATPPADDGRLAQGRALYVARDYPAALAECIQVGKTHPGTPGLETLRTDILVALAAQRADTAARRAAVGHKQAATEALEKTVIPDTYRLERRVTGVTNSHLSAAGPMQQVLDMPVSMHLKGAELATVIAALAGDRKLNIVADQALGKGKALDMDLDDVPLGEVLDYVERNFGVQCYMGKNMLWITAMNDPAKAPLETRVYRLRKGLQFHGSDWLDVGPKAPQGPEKSMLTYKATELPGGKSYLETLIEKFVPAEAGGQLHLDRNAHLLFVRNTAENLQLIERIIDAVDMTPPQVLIEARFIEVSVSDLRELGVDWMLNASADVTKKWVFQNGQWQRVAKTQIDSGNVVGFTPYSTDANGAFPLGPQGSFGLARDGNPATADQGLNLTYQGILTQPMFSAVLHLLEISGKGRTLSVPRVTTMNNNPAKLRHGEDLRFYEEFEAQAFNLVDDNNRRYTMTVLVPKGKPALEELGITLVAVPSVGADRTTISLMLTPTLSKLEGFVSYQDDSDRIGTGQDEIRQAVVKLPIVSRREIQTKVAVESGETVVMGGLIDSVEQETIHKVPFLGSIPLLGQLFKRVDTTEEKKNLIVFVTATVVSERGESLLPAEPAAAGTVVAEPVAAPALVPAPAPAPVP